MNTKNQHCEFSGCIYIITLFEESTHREREHFSQKVESRGYFGYLVMQRPQIYTLEPTSNSSQTVGLYEHEYSIQVPGASTLVMEGSRSLKFSFPSNICFLFGGLCFLMTAFHDLQQEDSDIRKEFHFMPMIATDDFAFNNQISASHRNLDSSFDTYNMTIVFGAGFYILNSLFDLCHCIYYVKKSPEADSLLHRSIRSSTMSAIFFGIAAWIDFWACLSDNINYDANLVAIMTSTLYLFSAISSVSGLEWNISNQALVLGFMGECLFVIGSILDCVTSYVSDPDLINLSQTDIHILAFVSSVLWVIDAFLYLVADIIIYRSQNGLTTDGHASLLNESALPERSLEECYAGEDEQVPNQSILV